MKNPIQLSHDFLAEVLTDQSIALDATMGNGYDTLFLAKHAKKVYAFDIQEIALKTTKEKLLTSGYQNVQLVLDSHEHIDNYLSEIDVAIFNLGYLPKADKTIVTKPDSTIKALEKTLALLKAGGRISIMVYYGHDGGQIEKDALEQFLKTLSQNQYTVMRYQPVNQVNYPPFLIMIEKRSL
ncbi:tRNA (mnm(5)s(2)U34)-methyltransferase [Streptococcus zalophi]|uniref:Class I SAM-dependent methyltransferase n=1 Tax=Streptococcus zalophi TaxID=640031 RepID=A0A934P9W4_9STRE|nr:class I SAM-dependent methyltransferase [Streptococcus zalophi]MBJ8349735.1 class I SAM-dependent methyltransferase [Streptococcus zalophi]MCR8967919.1 class I SAM-dependent methyltransferase [Streptococcus zalophi]